MASLKLKVEVTSREVIKPSSPTPSHLKTIKFSFIDQIAPPMYIPLLFFYQSEPCNDSADKADRSLVLKKSLSDVLVHFYPLAGRVQGNTSIDCNDQGVEYYEAKVSNNLLQIIENPNLEDLKGLLPFETLAHSQNILLGVQVNYFSCGGIAICVCISHKIADGFASVNFIRAWATMAQSLRALKGDDNHDGVLDSKSPKFDGASYFPPLDLNGIYTPESAFSSEKIVTKRFIFDKKMLDTLKNQAINISIGKPHVTNPTRVEVVSAFIWKHSMDARQGMTSNLSKIIGALHTVNLRPRIEPRDLDDTFGNVWWYTIALTDAFVGGVHEYPDLVRNLHEVITKVDKNRVKEIQNSVQCLAEMQNGNIEIQEFLVRFSSWCRFPVYEVDFGWGKPTWVSTTPTPLKNMVVLFSTRCGEGIEALVNMAEEDIVTLEHDLEVLSLATIPMSG